MANRPSENPFATTGLLSTHRHSTDRKGALFHDHLHIAAIIIGGEIEAPPPRGRRRPAAGHEARPVSAAAGLWPTEQVVSAAQQGDPAAIATLVSGSHQHVRRFAHTLCSTPEDAEDATQEALIVLYRKIGTLRATAALASWMFQIVRNECIRRSRLAFRRPSPVAAAEPSAEEAALARLEMKRIVESIAELPPEQRVVLVLRDIQGLSGAATARELGLSRAAMKSRLHRGREAVRLGLRAPRQDTTEYQGSDDA
jgi:RNA polymerase sigma factor (sigma-70 family)